MPTEPRKAHRAIHRPLWLIPLAGILISCAAYQLFHHKTTIHSQQRLEQDARLLGAQVRNILQRQLDEHAALDEVMADMSGRDQPEAWQRFMRKLRQRHGQALSAMAAYHQRHWLVREGQGAPLPSTPCAGGNTLSLAQDEQGRWLLRQTQHTQDHCIVSDWNLQAMLQQALSPAPLRQFHMRLFAQWRHHRHLVYSNSERARPMPLHNRQQFVLAELPFILETQPTPAWLAQHQDRTDLIALASGLFLTVLITLLLYTRRHVTRRLARKLEAQTRRLKQQHLELASVIDHAHDAVLLTGEDGMVLRANPAADALFGYHGETWHELSIHDLMTEASWLQFHAWSEQHATMPKRLYVRTASGETIPCESNIGSFLSNGHKRFALTLRDISAQIVQDWTNRALLQLRKISQQPSPLSERTHEMLETMFSEPWGIMHASAALYIREGDDQLSLVSHYGEAPDTCPSYRNAQSLPGNAETHLVTISDGHYRLYMRIRHKHEELGVLYLELRTHEVPTSFLDFLDHLEEILALMITSHHAEENLTHLSYYDALTGLPNRRLFIDRLHHAIAMAKRERGTLSVMFLDLDRFKAVNDTLGHDAGDEVLREAGRRLTQVLRESDTAARLGGDEFAVLLPKTNMEMASSVARKLLFSLQEPFHLQQHNINIGTSIGIATYPDEGKDVDALLKHADAAMYQAKKNHAHIHHFSGEMEARARRMLALEQDLTQVADKGVLKQHYLARAGAMLHGESDERVFPVYFQSKHRLVDGKVSGFESLLRWNHPVLGQVPPGEFIHLAEESGYIRAITNWVIFKACLQAEQWAREGIRFGPIAVNISAVQLMHEDMAKELIKIIQRAGAQPEWLEIEITETAAMHDPEVAAALMHELADIGIHIAIDDFGTGYSSLSYLKRFPAKALKIDRTFIQGLPDDADDRAIVRSTIAMAHALDMKVVAEGVENEGQYQFLREASCDEVQGFLFTQPMPPDAMTAFLREQGAKNTPSRS